ncbi:hypothetical protein GOP56_04905 [Brevibacillus sp. 7WMA2]|uniref:hypothetical protein n=1 Tax=Brevibacillus sp. 7WMA2 TaxID=2683193 RepID=UPI0013A7A623|nr:hypothetical protein [Brevibacillus sp. 7WMA2]QIC04989.1 hypothetical protein GOP56_04905 [Brevibacillus sp. 7WMA2]
MRMRGVLVENLPDRQGGYACSALEHTDHLTTDISFQETLDRSLRQRKIYR